MAQHRYWRIYITRSTSGADNLISLYEVEMRGAIGGADQCTGGTASAAHATASAGNLFDNNTGTYWVNGGPSADTWLKYDFSGGDVDVREIQLLPRYSSQSPEDFKLQYSDDDSGWTDACAWSGVTSWIGGVAKTFTLPGPPVDDQLGRPYALRLAAQRAIPFDLGLFLSADLEALFHMSLTGGSARPYALALAADLSQPFDRWLERSGARLYGLWVSRTLDQPWKRFLTAASRQPLFDGATAAAARVWSLRWPLAVGRTQPIVHTDTLGRALSGAWALLPHDPVAGILAGYWDLRAPSEPVVVQSPSVTVNGQSVPLLGVTLGQNGEQPGWRARLTIAREGDFQRLRLDDALTLTVGGRAFSLIVDGRSLHRTAPGPGRMVVEAVSPLARHARPRANPSGWTWPQAVQARAAVEAILGEAVLWQVQDWPIAAGRLDINGRTPLEAAAAIAGAVGAVVESTADGLVRVRYRFPVAVADWDGAVADQVLTDTADIFAVFERGRAGRPLDRLTLCDGEMAAAGRIRVELDQRPGGPNRGRKRFYPGGVAHLLVSGGPGVTAGVVEVSTGHLAADAPPTVQLNEDLAFVAASSATLSRPVVRLDGVTWLGNDLGTPELGADGRTVTVSASGTAIARVTATVAAQAYRYTAPASAAGLSAFPVLVSATADGDGQSLRTVTVQRRNGGFPGEVVAAPLLTDYRALYARGQQELDAGEVLQEVELVLACRPGLEPGQLLAVHDGRYGRSFRALVTAVTVEAGEEGEWRSRVVALKRG